MQLTEVLDRLKALARREELGMMDSTFPILKATERNSTALHTAVAMLDAAATKALLT